MNIFKGCLYCGRDSLREMEFLYREEYSLGAEKSPFTTNGEKVGGNITFLMCDDCGFIHPFHKEKRKKYIKPTKGIQREIKWKIR
ncbi:hypothetical protein [Rossellomorea aquimaris]|uniref:hypothetical protein n=1 Tax=Rossellomorea aquimaris TaxID=189382 RepID=UPI0007D05502|nr:hypothetical protein [Rossellomorea aquimaris]